MTMLAAITDWDSPKSMSIGLRVQRVTAIVIAFAGLAFATTGHGSAGYFVFAWFILAALIPFVFGRMIGVGLAIVCGFAIFMGDNGSGTTFRMDAAIAMAPVLLLAGIVGNRAFAGFVGRLAIAGWQMLLPAHEEA